MTTSRAGAASAPAVSQFMGAGSYVRNGSHLALHDADGSNVTLYASGPLTAEGGQYAGLAFGVFEPLPDVVPGSTISDGTFGVSFSADLPNSSSTFLTLSVTDCITGTLVAYSSIATGTTAGTTFTAPLRAAVSADAICAGAVSFSFGPDTGTQVEAGSWFAIDHVWMDVTWTPPPAAAATAVAPLRLRQNGGGAQPPLRLRQDGAA